MPKYNQGEWIKKINLYLAHQQRDILLNEKGMSHGLTLLWLHFMHHQDEAAFYHFIKETIDSDVESLAAKALKLDSFIAKVATLQNPEY